MFRKELLELLQEGPLTVAEIARRFEAKPKEVAEDLRHLAKSLKHEAYRLVVEPAVCMKCDFVFSKEKLMKPGKCPECKGTWIDDPVVRVEPR